MSDESFRVYLGNGTTLRQRGGQVPRFTPPVHLDDPSRYLAGEGLRDAVNVAVMLGQPLLVTGEPGTGKTQLAGSLAYELDLPAPLVFYTKSTSVARDLFYRYDSLAHFHDAQFRRDELPLENYLTYEALGLAILLAMDPAQANPYLPPPLQNQGPIRSVVLVDEIDKAPRDLPNDLLNEIEGASFQVRETGRNFTAMPEYRPIVVVTSNSERNLPDAFLRRCVFYSIPFPTGALLKEIVLRRLAPGSRFTPQMLQSAIRHFEQIRELSLKKKPATAELLAWLQVLERRGVDVADLKPGDAEVLAFSYCLLAKSREDREVIERQLLPELE